MIIPPQWVILYYTVSLYNLLNESDLAMDFRSKPRSEMLKNVNYCCHPPLFYMHYPILHRFVIIDLCVYHIGLKHRLLGYPAYRYLPIP